MKNQIEFRKTVETGVDLCCPIALSAESPTTTIANVSV